MNLLPFEKIKREILTKQETSSNKEFGKNPEDRDIEELLKYGIINVNKPEGPTSHQITAYLKEILHIEKAGHSGTLDPKVTGSLPTAIEKATRIVQSLLTSGKEYICLMKIHEEKEEKEIREIMNSFIGKIEQLPPVRSAVKRRIRTREIYYLEILEIEDRNVLFRVGCQAGTYIRKLCHDIGQKLETSAHMAQLIRTKAGPFREDTWHSLQEIKDAYEFYKEGDEKPLKKIILPIEKAIDHLPKIWITDSTVDAICHGAELAIPGIAKIHSKINKKDSVAIMTLKDELVATGIAELNSEEIIKKNKGIAAKTKKILFFP